MKYEKKYFGVILVSLLFLTITISAQQTAKYFAGCNLQASKVSHVHYTPPPETVRGDKTSEFQITFKNATEEQKACVNYAAEIWSSILVSDVPIKVLVTFYSMNDFLGQSVSNIIKNFDGAPTTDTWYLASLADAITGKDQQPGEYDMDIFFTSAANWYYGLDGKCPSNKFDLVDVSLHEMCHGLGYFGLGYINNGEGSYGHITSEALTRPIVFEFPELEGMPTSFDRAIANSQNEYFTDTTMFGNPSAELKNLFLGDDLFFMGENAIIANGNQPVKLYAPSTFYFASSILHLDEDTYPAGNINTLMTPYVDYGEANHNPGPVTFGLLKDLGWTLNDSITVDVPEDNIISNNFTLSQNYPNPFNPTTTIKFTVPTSFLQSSLNHAAGMEDKLTTLLVYNILGQQLKTLVNEQKSPGGYEIQFDGSDLPSGIYFYSLRVGDKVQSKKMILMK